MNLYEVANQSYGAFCTAMQIDVNKTMTCNYKWADKIFCKPYIKF